MEGLDACAVLEDGAELRAGEDLQRAANEWWRFTTTSVLQPGLMMQERELAAPGPLVCSSRQRAEARRVIDVPKPFREHRRRADRQQTGGPGDSALIEGARLDADLRYSPDALLALIFTVVRGHRGPKTQLHCGVWGLRIAGI